MILLKDQLGKTNREGKKKKKKNHGKIIEITFRL